LKAKWDFKALWNRHWNVRRVCGASKPHLASGGPYMGWPHQDAPQAASQTCRKLAQTQSCQIKANQSDFFIVALVHGGRGSLNLNLKPNLNPNRFDGQKIRLNRI
jgi:hypothetical protein